MAILPPDVRLSDEVILEGRYAIYCARVDRRLQARGDSLRAHPGADLWGAFAEGLEPATAARLVAEDPAGLDLWEIVSRKAKGDL